MTGPNHTVEDFQQPLGPGMAFEWMLGPIRMAVLRTAVELELPDILQNHSAPDAIAKALGATGGSENVVRFLDAMAAMQLAEKENGHYANSPFALRYLCRNAPCYLGELIHNLSDMQHRNLDDFPELIRNGPPATLPEKDRLDVESRWKQSVRHLVPYHRAGIGDTVADFVASFPEFPSMRRMLDIGCGPGIMCMTVLSRNPGMTGVLCDLSPVLEVAREEVEAAGMSERMTLINGDYNDVDFGNGYDLIWASHTLYYARDLAAMLEKIHESLNPGGIFVSFHEGLEHERTQPSGVVLSRLSLALEGQEVSFERGEIASLMSVAGFSSIETREVPLPLGPMEAVIGRKRSSLS